MAEDIKMGPDQDKLMAAITEAFGGIKKQSKEIATLTVESKGVEKTLSEFEDLNKAIEKYNTLVANKKNNVGLAKYFGSEEKMISNLKAAWNSYVKDYTNGVVDINDLSKSNSAKLVLRNANALEALYGRSSYENISGEMTSLIDEMRSMDKFAEGKQYNASIGHFKAVLPIVKEINDLMSAYEFSAEAQASIFEKLGLSDLNKVKEITTNILELGDAVRKAQQETGSATGTGVGDAMAGEAEQAEEAAKKTEEAAKKYKEATKEMLEADLKASHKKQKVSFDDFYEFDDTNDRTVKNISQKIKELASRKDLALSEIERYNNKLANSETQKTLSSGRTINYEKSLQEEIRLYHTYTDQIDFLQDELQKATLEFQPGDSWGVDEINVLIQLLQNLVKTIQDVSKAFGNIDDEAGITPLLSQLSTIGDTINNAFNTGNVDKFTSSLEEMSGAFDQIISKLNKISTKEAVYNISVQKGDTGLGTDSVAEQEWAREYQKMLNAYNRIFAIAKKNGLNNQEAISSLYNSKDVTDALYGVDALSKYNLSGIQASSDLRDRIKAMVEFFNYLNMAQKEMADADAWDKAHGYTTEDNNVKQFLNETARYMRNSDAVTGSYRTVEERVNRRLNQRNAQDIDLDQIQKDLQKQEDEATEFSTIIDKLETSFKELQNVFKQGFGISDDTESVNYLEKLSKKMEEVASTAKEFSEALSGAMNKSGKEVVDGGVKEKVQEALDEGSVYPIKVGLDPTTSISDQVQEALNSGDYKIKVKGELIDAEETKKPVGTQTEQHHSVSRERADGSIVTDSKTTTSNLTPTPAPSLSANTIGNSADGARSSVQSLTGDVQKLGNALDGAAAKAGEVRTSLKKAEDFESPISSGTTDTDFIIESEERVGNAAEEATDKIVKMYRAFNSQHGVTGKDMSWFTDDLETAGTYFKNATFSGGRKDSLAQLETDTSKFMSVDANGSHWGEISYDGKIYTANELAELAKQAGYIGLEIRNVYDSVNGEASKLMSNVYTIFDDNIVSKAKDQTTELETELQNFDVINKRVNESLNMFSGRPTDVFESAEHGFQEIVDLYKSGSITIEQALSGIDETRESILSKDNIRNDFTNKVTDLWKTLKSESDYSDDIYMGFGKNDVWKSTLQGFLDGTIEEQKALQDLETEFRRVLELSNKTPVSEPETHPEQFEREAEAAAEDREEIEKLNNAKRESPEPQTDSAEMARRAQLIQEEEENYSNSLTDANIKSIQRMYDSHDNLVQSVITTVKTLENEDGQILEQLDHYQIKWDGKGNALYGSRMTSDDYQKYFGASDQSALEEAIRQNREYEEREKAYQEERARLIAEGKIQEREQSLRDSSWTEMERKKEVAEAKELEQIEQQRLKTIEKRKSEEKKLQEAQNKQINKAQEDAWKEQERQRQKQEEEDNRRITRQAQEEARIRLQEEENYQKERARLIAEGRKQEEAIIKQNEQREREYERLFASQDRQSQRKTQADAEKTRKDSYVSELNEYNKARRTYEMYKGREYSGKTLSSTETSAMEAALKTIQTTEEQWNKSKSDGIALASKQADIEKELQNAAQERLARANGADSKLTEEILEQNAAQKEAIKLRDSLAKKISNMYDQKEWRADSEKWDIDVENLENRLGTLDPTLVKSKKELDKYKESLRELAQDRQNLAKSSAQQPIGQDWQNSALANLNKWMDQNKIAAKAYREELLALRDAIADVGSKGGAEDWNAQFQFIQAQAADNGLLGKSLGDRFKDQFKNTMTSLATYYLSFQDFIRYGREAISVVTELDTQLTEMRKVSNESLQTLQQYQLESFDIADRVGTTASQIQSSTADWMRLGEDLQEAKKSAEQSTLLLNVSEFTDIGDATKALTAMSQAYTELEKSEIIDKLNNIGNNFSISTSELAESLQKSAGTLKVTGDSLDEAIALTVAGNQVLQNPDIVGQSLKTISLRLSGTSVKDMQEAGEEIDGLITTQSKLRQVIMDATKVASNNYKGFDILNDDGSYKTTYERLLGIAEVFKEIGEEDKKLGTNRQSFLLETIANSLLWYVEIHMRNIFNCR